MKLAQKVPELFAHRRYNSIGRVFAYSASSLSAHDVNGSVYDRVAVMKSGFCYYAYVRNKYSPVSMYLVKLIGFMPLKSDILHEMLNSNYCIVISVKNCRRYYVRRSFDDLQISSNIVFAPIIFAQENEKNNNYITCT